jgi:hypothetical protein
MRNAAILSILLLAGCGDLDVVTENYATLQEAAAAGAIDRGWVPRGLPPGARELRSAHDLDSNRRWGLFSFPPDQSSALKSLVASEISLAGHTCNPPRRIEWWPLVLRERLDHDAIASTGLRAYAAREGDLIFAVNWNQGRAYYWTRE